MIKSIKNLYEKQYSKVRIEAIEKNVTWRNVVLNTMQISLILGLISSLFIIIGFSKIIQINSMQDTVFSTIISYVMMPMPLILGTSIFFYTGSIIARANIMFFYLIGKGIQKIYDKYFMNYWKKNKQDPKIFNTFIKLHEKFNLKYTQRQRKLIMIIPEIIILIIIFYPRAIDIYNNVLTFIPTSTFGIHW